jgi:hypothetical protein
VVGGGEVRGNIAELKKSLPVVRSEDGVAVRDNTGRETMEADDMLEEEIGYCRGGEGLRGRNEVGLFGESVDDN